MLCKQFKKIVWDYLDGRLAARPAGLYAVHLKDCLRCRDTLARARRLLELLKNELAPLPPAAYRDSFWPRLRERISAKGRPARPRFVLRFNPLYYAAIGAAAAALVLWISFRESPAPLFRPMEGRGSGHPVDFVMSIACPPAGKDAPEIDYISGPFRSVGGRERAGTDYILPGATGSGVGRFEV